MTISPLPQRAPAAHAGWWMTSTTIDLYRILGVARSSDMATLRSAYRHRARRYHPDAGGDERRMMALNKAWGILRNPEKREAYDREQRWPAVGTFARPGSHASPPPPVGRAFGTVLDFGRYAGWSFGQLAIHDPDYLLWLERTPIGRPMHAEIRAILEQVRVEPPPPSRPPTTRRRSFAGLRG
jgi:curved DNA-binding protein CbpA